MKLGDADAIDVRISKRRTISFLAILLMGQSFPTIAVADKLTPVDTHASLENFIRLSVFLTNVKQLDLETAERIYHRILGEPWGKEHLALITERIRALQIHAHTTLTLQQLLTSPHFMDDASKGERWFIDHLLTTWFTGIYYHQSGNHVITYRDALMHAALQDVRPIPGHCNAAFGHWADPPVLVVQ